MKKLLFGFLLLITSMSAKAQWTRLDLPSGAYRDIFFSAEKTGFLVGDSGMVLKTVDDGVTWRKIDVDTKPSFASVAFVDPSTGFLLSRDKLFKSTDAGETWEEVKSDSVIGGRRILFMTEKIGFIEGSVNGLLKTSDGGETWHPVSLKYFNNIYHGNFPANDVIFGSDGVGFCFGREPIELFISRDSGTIWENIRPVTYDGFNGQNIEAVWFHDEKSGCIGGWYDGFLTSTSDGGLNWASATCSSGSYRLLKDSSGWLRHGVYDIYFPTRQTGYAIGQIDGIGKNQSFNGIIKTKNGGISWTYLQVDEALQWYPSTRGAKVYFTSENNGYLLSGNNYSAPVLKTTTGGEEPVSIHEPLLQTISNKISPNPFKNTARIELPENLLKTEIRIMTANGEDCSHRFKTLFEGNSIIIERNEAAAGVYFYTIENESKVVSEGKFVVE